MTMKRIDTDIIAALKLLGKANVLLAPLPVDRALLVQYIAQLQGSLDVYNKLVQDSMKGKR